MGPDSRITRAVVATFVATCTATAIAQDETAPKQPELAKEAERLAAEAPPKKEIVVTATRTEDGLPVVPLSATGSRDVVGPGILDGTVRSDVNALVRLAPAVSSRPYNGGDASAPSFSIRGLPDDGLTEYILVEIDGVPASPLPYGWTAFSFLPVTAERVHGMEVIRGGFAVRHSPNSAGGVLNLITNPIPLAPTARLSNTFGSDGYRSTMASVGGTKDGLGALLTYVDKEGDGYRDDGDFTIRDTSLKLRLEDEPGRWIQADVTYFVDAHRAPGGLTVAQYEADRFGNSREPNHFNGYRTLVSLVAHGECGGGDWIEAFGSYSYTARRLRALPEEGPPIAIDAWDDETKVAIAGARGTVHFDAFGTGHELYAGVRAQSESLPSWKIVETPFATNQPTTLQDRSYSLYAFSAHADDTFHPVKRMTVTLGARAEWVPVASGRDELGTNDFDDRFFAVLPGADASYELSDWCAVYANAHESFRAPQVWGFNFSGADQDLDFEKGRSFEGGTRVRAPHGVSGSAAVWRVDFDDVATFDKGYYDNFGRIVAEGVDFVAAWDVGEVIPELRGFSVQGSWTHQDSELREGAFRGNATPYAWDDKAAVSARWQRDGWLAALDWTYFGSTWSDEAHSEEDPTGFVGFNRSVSSFDARLSKSLQLATNVSVDLGVGVTNLFDTERFVHSRGGFFGGGRVAYAPRQVYVSAGFTANF